VCNIELQSIARIVVCMQHPPAKAGGMRFHLLARGMTHVDHDARMPA
jgi:hypothetical protein